MPYNPKFTKQATAYVDLEMHRRMVRISDKNGRYSVSRQIEYALIAHMSTLERLVGLKPKR